MVRSLPLLPDFSLIDIDKHGTVILLLLLFYYFLFYISSKVVYENSSCYYVINIDIKDIIRVIICTIDRPTIIYLRDTSSFFSFLVFNSSY